MQRFKAATVAAAESSAVAPLTTNYSDMDCHSSFYLRYTFLFSHALYICVRLCPYFFSSFVVAC